MRFLQGIAKLRTDPSVASAAHAANYTASDETSFRNAIASANADGDPSATITLTNNISIADPAAFPAFVKPITVNTASFTLQGADIPSGTAVGTSLTFSGGSVITTSNIRGGNAAVSGSNAVGAVGVALPNGSLTNNGTITGGTGGGSGSDGVGVSLTGSTGTNNGTINGGSAGPTGVGGTGLVMNNSTFINNGTIIGGNSTVNTRVRGLDVQRRHLHQQRSCPVFRRLVQDKADPVALPARGMRRRFSSISWRTARQASCWRR